MTPAQASTSGVSGFNVLQVSWGTSSTHVSAAPGMQDVPLTVTLEYIYATSATETQLALQLPSGFTDYDGNPTATAFIAGSVSPATIQEVTFYVDIPGNATLGEYAFPLDLSWTISLSSTETQSLFQQTSATVYLKGAPNLEFQAQEEPIVAGEVNQISLTLENTGSGSASDISTAVSAQGATVLEQPAEVGALDAGSNVPQQISLYVPSSAGGSALLLTFTSSYVDPYNNTGTSTFSLGLVVSSSTQTNGVQLWFTTQQQALTPGSVNEVTITVTNQGTNPARDLVTSISTSGGATILTQPPAVASLKAETNANLSLSIFVPTSLEGSAITLTLTSTYFDIANNSDSETSSLGLLVSGTTSASTEPVSVTVAGNSMIAGATSTVSFLVKNAGDTPIYSPTVSFTASSPIVVVANSSESYSGLELSPGETLTFDVVLSSSPSATGGAYAGSLSIGYQTASGTSQSETLSVGITIADQQAQVSVKALDPTLYVGEASNADFVITNTGNVPLYSPSFSLSAPSSISVLDNSTFAKAGMVLNPGQSFTYETRLSSGPSTAEGAYSGTVTVSYSDQFGNSHSLSSSFGFLLIGSIDLVVQSETTSQSSGDITVSGTLLNEGEASAYYVTLVANATIDGRPVGGGSDYVGEVEPNTPVAFSITVTFTGFAGLSSNQTLTSTTGSSSTSIASATGPSTTTSTSSSSRTFTLSGNFTGSFTRTGSFTFSGTPTVSTSSTSDPSNSTSTTSTTSTSSISPPTIVAVSLSGSYQNDYGLAYSYSGPSKTVILASSSASTTPSSSSSSSQAQTIEYARIALILALVAAIIGSVFYVRRARRLAPPHQAASAKDEPVI